MDTRNLRADESDECTCRSAGASARAVISAALVLSSFAWPGTTFSGTVVDQKGEGYPGVEVRLHSIGLSTKTDAQGRWSLSSSSAVIHRPEAFRNTHWIGSVLEIKLDAPRTLQLRLVDRAGRQVGAGRTIQGKAGLNKIPWRDGSFHNLSLVSVDGGPDFAVSWDSLGGAQTSGFAGRVALNVLDTLAYSVAGSRRSYKTFYGVSDTSELFQLLIRQESSWDSITDSRDGEKYRVVTFRNFLEGKTLQWMTSNLRYLPKSGHAEAITSGNSDDGIGYSWATAVGLHDSCDTVSCYSQVHDPLQGICPPGWKLTSSQEWEKLREMIIDQDERYEAGRGVLESLGAKDARWNSSQSIALPVAEVRDFFGLSIPPSTLHYWLSTPWPDSFNVYGEKSSIWQDFRRNARVIAMQYEIMIDEARKTALLPVRCYREK